MDQYVSEKSLNSDLLMRLDSTECIKNPDINESQKVPISKPVKQTDKDKLKNALDKAPPYGTPVPKHILRRAGDYLLGPKLGSSPVKSIVQCLARKDNTDKFYLIKVLLIFN